MRQPSGSLEFRYKIVLAGNATDLSTAFGRRGVATDSALELASGAIAYDQIADTQVRDNRLVLLIDPNAALDPRLRKKQIEGCLVLEIRKASPRALEQKISRERSRQRVEARRDELLAAGQSELFRSADCPHCGAALDLSDLDESPYVYCEYCESVFDRAGQIVTNGDDYSICDGCNLFDRTRGYTEGYFYFLIAVWGYRTQRKFVCDSCAGRMFWKLLFANLIFVLGVPNAIVIGIKSLTRRTDLTRKLAEANAKVRKGQCREVAAVYATLYRRHPDHPGLCLNEAIAAANANDGSGLSSQLERCLKACANYLPAIRLVQQLRQSAA